MTHAAVLSFLTVVLLILGLIHGFLYLSFTSFFEITSPVAKRVLPLFLVLLSLSPLVSSIGVRVFPGAASRIYYSISWTLFGVVLYLTLASALLWVTAVPLRWLPGVNLSRLPTYSAVALYSLAVLFSIYNLGNARIVRVTSHDISLKNLPETWRGKTVAQLSDLHLGALWNHRFLDSVVRKTLALRPDMIVITGDLFDGSSNGQEKFIEGLKRLDAPRGVYFISGNHEVYSGVEHAISVVEKAGIRVIDGQLVDVEGMQLIGVGSPRPGGVHNPAFTFSKLQGYDSSRPAILLYHTPTDVEGSALQPGASHSPYLSPDVNYRAAMEAGVSLQLSGHTHAGQFIPFTWLTEKIYGGFHYGLKRIGDFQIYIHSGTGTWGAPFRSGRSSEIALFRFGEVPGD